MKTRTERLATWISTLSESKKDSILLELINYAIDSEEVAFYKDTQVPYWSNSVEQIDGSERDDDTF